MSDILAAKGIYFLNFSGTVTHGICEIFSTDSMPHLIGHIKYL